MNQQTEPPFQQMPDPLSEFLGFGMDLDTRYGRVRVCFKLNRHVEINPYWMAPVPGQPDLVAKRVKLAAGLHELPIDLFEPDVPAERRKAAALPWLLNRFPHLFDDQDDEAGTPPFSIRTDFEIDGALIPVWWCADGTGVVVQQGCWDDEGPAAGRLRLEHFLHGERIDPDQDGPGLAAGLRRIFAEVYNDRLRDKLLLDGAPEYRRQLRFAKGDKRRFEAALQDAMRLTDGIEDWPDNWRTLIVRTGTPASPASCSWQGTTSPQAPLFSDHYVPDTRTRLLCERILLEADPTAWRAFQSSLSMPTRFSTGGWQFDCECLILSVEAPSASEKIEALFRLEEALDFYGVGSGERRELFPE